MSLESTNTQRLFFALRPDARQRAQLAGLLDQMSLVSTARRVIPADLHLTLMFLGSVQPVTRHCVEQAAAEIQGRGFLLNLNRIGYWPRPHALWLAPTLIPQQLLSLVQALHSGLAACNFSPEVRPYRPHVTLARNIKNFAGELSVPVLTWCVNKFSLMESCSGFGATRYRLLKSWPLLGADEPD